MAKNSIFGIFKNAGISVLLAVLLSVALSFIIYPQISSDKINEAEFVALLSEENSEINKVIENNEQFYIEFKNKKEIVEIIDIKDSTMFVNLISLNKVNYSHLKIKSEPFDAIWLALQTFSIFIILFSLLILLELRREFVKNPNNSNTSFLTYFFDNFSNFYSKEFFLRLQKDTDIFSSKVLAICFVFIIASNIYFDSKNQSKTAIPNKYIYSDLITDINEGKISYIDIMIEDDVSNLSISDVNGKTYKFQTGDTSQLKSMLNDKQISYNENNGGDSIKWTPYIITFIILLVVLLLVSGFGRMLSKKNPLLNGKSFEIVKEKPEVTLLEVKGIDEIKEEISEVVELLNKKQKMNDLGGYTPKGILINGDPGVGKTLLAKAIANETDYNFISTNGSSFAGSLQGQGAESIRNLFKEARKNMPCIVFIDEIDGVGRKRGSDQSGSDNDRTLNQLLTELDGFDDKENADIIVIGATNFPDKLDPALTRAGRFDREITIPLPNYKGRLEILNMYINKVKAVDNLDLDFIAHHTSGMSGATLKNLVNEAALLAGRKDKKIIELEDFEEAQAKLVMGHKLAIEMSEKEKWMTAYHEAGHAIISKHIGLEHMKVHKVSIIPRGRALGVTMYVPEGEKYSHSKQEIEASISSLYGGRIAEELLMGADEVTTGASNDFEVATKKAESMIKYCGLGTDNLLTLGYKDSEFQNNLSEADRIEMQKILKRNYVRACKILQENKGLLKEFAKGLMFYDVVEKEQIDSIFEGNDITLHIDIKGNEISQLVPEEYDITKKDFIVYEDKHDE
jgi:cell division protease FtsH